MSADSSIHIDTTSIEWQEAPGEGVWVKKLFRHKDSGNSSLLIKLEPGAVYHAHRHTGEEHYYVLEGTLEDGGKTISAGGYVHHRPGTAHCPRSADGCIVFATLGKPVEPVGEGACKGLGNFAE